MEISIFCWTKLSIIFILFISSINIRGCWPICPTSKFKVGLIAFIKKSKTLVSETNQGKTEISYEVSGDVLTFKDVKNPSLKDKDKDVFSNYMKIAKFKKVK